MGQYLTNIGEVNTASVTVVASMGALADVNVINSAGWEVIVTNTATQTELLAGTALVGTINTVAIGGADAVDILNSAGWVVSLLNTANWLVSVENTANVVVVGTVAVGSNQYIVNSAGWVVSASATIMNSSNLQTIVTNTVNALDIINSAGWVVSVANTSLVTSIVNSAGWIVNVANTGGLYTLLNTAGWVVSVANTQTAINVINTAGLVVSVSNTGGTVAVSNTSPLVKNTIETDQMSSSGTVTYPNFLPISLATTEYIVPASANKVIRVLGFEMMANVANQVNFQTGTAGADLTGVHYLAASGGLVCGYQPTGWFQTAAGDGLVLELAVAGNIGGSISYLVL